MTPDRLIASLLENGFELWAEDNELCFRAPKGALTPELRDAVRAHKAALITALGQGRRHLFLSESQQRMWFLTRLDPLNPAYNIPFAVLRFSGPLGPGALQASLQTILDRHEALRVGFLEIDGHAIQVGVPSCALEMPIDDLEAIPAPLREPEAIRRAIEETRRPFDLAAGPFLRARLLRLEPETHILVLTMHHIATDVWSMQVCIRELAMLYPALSAGAPSPLPPLPGTYRDFLHGQRQLFRSGLLETQLEYWKRQLEGAPPLLNLPADRPRPAAPTFQGAHASFRLSPALTDAVKALSRLEGVTPFMVLLAAFNTLLYRYSGQDDIVVGVPIAGRARPETRPLIGLFADTLVLRSDLAGNPSFRALLARQRQITLEAYAHDAVPLARIVEVTRPERNSAYNPLFQVLFDFLAEGPVEVLELGDVTLRSMDVERGVVDVDLFFILYEEGQGIRGVLEYATDLFDRATIARLLMNFQTLLEAAVRDPDQRLQALPILGAEERQWLEVHTPGTLTANVDGCRNSAMRVPRLRPLPWPLPCEGRGILPVVSRPFEPPGVPGDCRTTRRILQAEPSFDSLGDRSGLEFESLRDDSIDGQRQALERARLLDALTRPDHHGTAYERFLKAASRRPHAAAIYSDLFSVTYTVLDAHVRRLADALLSLDVGLETVVGIYATPGPAMAASLLGAWRLGAACVLLDPTVPLCQTRQLLTASGAAVILVQAELASRLTHPGLPLVLVDPPQDIRPPASPPDGGAVDKGPGTRPSPRASGMPDGSTLALLAPAGSLVAALEHQALLRQLDWLELELGRDGGPVVTTADPSRLTLVYDVLFGLVSGRGVVFPAASSPEDLDALCTLAQRHRAGILTLPPSRLAGFAQACRGRGDALHALQWVLTDGEPPRREVLEAFGRHVPARLLYQYCPPEAGSAVAATASRPHPPAPLPGAGRGENAFSHPFPLGDEPLPPTAPGPLPPTAPGPLPPAPLPGAGRGENPALQAPSPHWGGGLGVGSADAAARGENPGLQAPSPQWGGGLGVGSPGSRVWVLDDQLEPVPLGVVGEICIAGPGLARGYVNAPDATHRRFTTRAIGSAAQRLLRTGDRGRWREDGTLELTEPSPGQAWLDGRRIDLARIEAALLTEPAIDDCSVMVRDGGSSRALVAYVVTSRRVTLGRLEAHLNATLPRWMVPSIYVPVTRLPLTRHGAIDAGALRRLQIVTSELAQRWEHVLARQPGIAEAAVVVRELEATAPLVHVSELLPDWRATGTPSAGSGRGVAPAEASVVTRGTSPDTVALPPALSDGGPLPDDPDAPTTLAALLERAASGGPLDGPAGGPLDDPAVTRQPIPAAGGITYVQEDGSALDQTFAQLLEEARRILGGLRARGLRPGDRAVLLLPRVQDLIPAFWGCVLGGLQPAIVSLPPNPDAPVSAEKLSQIWELLEGPVGITEAALAGPLEALLKSAGGVDRTTGGVDRTTGGAGGTTGGVDRTTGGVGGTTGGVDITTGGVDARMLPLEALRGHPPDIETWPADPEDIALLNLTSGSTGRPKCIQLRHRNLIRRARGTNAAAGYSSTDVILNWLPFDHIGSISDWHIRCMLLGCRQIFTTKDYVLGQPLRWLDLMDRYRVTHSWAPNFAYALVQEALSAWGPAERPRRWDLSCVRGLLTAGESISSKVVEGFLSGLEPYGLPTTALQPAFGMAELGSGVTYFRTRDAGRLTYHRVHDTALGAPIHGSIHGANGTGTPFVDLGRPIPGISLRIVDAAGQVLPEQTIGRLQVRGEPVFAGYLRAPDVTREVFTVDGWFDTGDLGFLIDGALVMTGRAKETLVLNGANYACAEIEAVVQKVEGVEASCVAACAVRDPGDPREHLAVFFSTPVPMGPPMLDLLRRVRERVARDIGVSADYVLPVDRAAVPRTAIGKIQRAALSARFERGELDETLKQIDLLSGNERTLPDRLLRRVWRPRAIRTLEAPADAGPVLVLLDHAGLGETLCARLEASGRPWISVEAGRGYARLARTRFQVDPADPAQSERLLETLAAEDRRPAIVLDLMGYGAHDRHGYVHQPPASARFRSPEPHDPAPLPVAGTGVGKGSGERSLPRDTRGPVSTGDVEAVSRLIGLARALAAVHGEAHPVRLFVAASHAQPVLATDEASPVVASVPPLVLTLPQELPWLETRHIDLPPEGALANAERLLEELRCPGPEREVAYRQGRRLVPGLEAAPLPRADDAAPSFKHGGTYLVSGGLGGIGLEVSRMLLEQYGARLLLIGRTASPPGTLGSLQTLGQVQYEPIDVCDLPRLRQAVAAARERWGAPLEGVIHLAGRYHERLLIDETADGCRDLMQARVGGAWTLGQLAKLEGAGVIVHFSSVTSLFGGALVGAYGASSRALECVAHAQRHQGLRSYCLSWSPWNGVGLSRVFEGREALQARGIDLLAPRAALYLLRAALRMPPGAACVGLASNNPNIQRLLDAPVQPVHRLTAYVTARSPGLTPGVLSVLREPDAFGLETTCDITVLPELPRLPTGEIDRERLASDTGRATIDLVPPKTELEQLIAGIWREVLKVEQVGVNQNFFDLGGHSVLLYQVHRRLVDALQREFSIMTLFRFPTIAALVGHLSAEPASAISREAHEERADTRRTAANRQRQLRQQHRTGGVTRRGT